MPKSASQTQPPVVRMVVVEPYVIVRMVLRSILSRERDIAIVGEVADIDAALALLRDDAADVVLVDADLADAGLVPGLQRLRHECPGSGVIVIGHRRDDDELFRAIEAGAAAYLPDTVRPTELGNTIRAVAEGAYLIDQSVASRPALARLVLEAFRETSHQDQVPEGVAPQRPFEPLSARETEVLMAISEGMSNNDIVGMLSIRPHTVKKVMTGILRKLAVNNRTQAVLSALRRSPIPSPDEPAHRLN